MSRKTLASAYVWSVGAAGLLLLLITTAVGAPSDLRGGAAGLGFDVAVLFVLTLLSSISPLKTRIGAVVTVGLAPLFGAFIVLPSWAVMWVATLGTVDERRPGRDISWDRFTFNRGLYALMYGVPSLLFHATGIWQRQTIGYLALLPIAVVLMVTLNVGLIALVFSLQQGTGLGLTAQKMVAGTWPTYIALPLVGYLIAVLIQSPDVPTRLLVFFFYGPLLVYRASLQKQNRLDQWLRDSFIMQSRIVDKRDGQTFGHSQRVGELCESVARALHLSEEACNTIRTAGILHDLGKIAIPDSILLKPAKLTPEEYEIIKTHPDEGAQILAEHPEQKGVAGIVKHHHERWDGAGYPDGLKGDDIPIGSRIVNACDAFDTITQARVFRPTVRTPAEAIAELRELAGAWYDPAVITALENIVAERWGVAIARPPQQPVAHITYGSVLAIKAFRNLWVGQAVSYFGDMMNTTGLAIMLYLVTRSPLLVALGLIAKAAPTILFGLLAGPLVDRFDRQRLMISSDLIRALLTITIPFLALHWLPGVYVTVFLVSTASAFFNPAKQAVVPNLVPNHLLVRANSLIRSSEVTMELLGYSVAGLIATAVSWRPLFFIDAATFIISAVTLLNIPDVGRLTRPRQLRLVEDILQGARFITRNETLRSTMGLTFMAALFVGLTYPVLVLMSYGPLNGGALGYGLLEAAIGAGAIVGAAIGPSAMRRFPAGILVLAGVAGMGVANALTGFSQAVWMAMTFLFFGGIASTVYYVPVISVTQREAGDHVRGRVMSTRFILLQLGLLIGMAIAGPLAARLGPQVVYTTSGFLLVCSAVVGLAFRSLRDARFKDEPIQPGQPVLKATASG